MIDPAYQLQLRELHGQNRFDRGRKTYGIVKDFLRTYRPATVLDFGCSQGGPDQPVAVGDGSARFREREDS